MTMPAEPPVDPTEPLPTEPPADDFDISLSDMEALFEEPAEQPEEQPADPADAEQTPPAPAEDPVPAGDEGGEAVSQDAADPSLENADPEPQPAAQDPEPQPEPTTPTVPVDAVEIGGQLYPRETVEGVIEWARSLTPEQIALLEQQATAAPAPQQAPAAPAATTPAPEQQVPEFVDPELAQFLDQRLSPLEQRLAKIAEQEEARIAREQAEQDRITQEAVAEARRGTAEKFGLSDEDMKVLEMRTAQSGIVQLLAQQYVNQGRTPDPTLFGQALETTFWTTPEFRERAIQAQVAQARGEAQVSAVVEERKSNAAALAGTGAAAPRVSQPVEPKTQAERDEAIINELAEAMGQKRN